MPIELFVLVGLGMVVGFFAGLLGIGGGGIMVPALTAFFLHQGHNPNQVVHMALATSLSCIIFNASISIHSHQKHQAILWPVVQRLAPFVVTGSVLASLLAVKLSSQTLAIVFALFMLLIALQMLLNFKPEGVKQHIGSVKLSLSGFIIGFISALMAIGGGSLTVPFLNWHQINIKKCIATAAAVGLPIALAGTATFVFTGMDEKGLELNNPSENTLGFVYWPATIALSLGAVITTPVGAHLTHRLPVQLLKKVFAALLVILALKMYFSLS